MSMLLRFPCAQARRGVSLTALCVLLSACGGGEALSEVADPAALVVALDLDRYDSFDAVASAAARERGTPGEQERVLVLVHSRRTGEASRMAERLRSQGLPVRAIDADDALPLRHARS